MTVRKNYSRHGLRFIALNLLSGLPFLAALAFILIRGFKLIWDTWSWIAIGICIVNFVLGFIWQIRRSKRMKCPDCKQMIFLENFKNMQPNDHMLFHCENCDIEWDTGLCVPGGSDIDGGGDDICGID